MGTHVVTRNGDQWMIGLPKASVLMAGDGPNELQQLLDREHITPRELVFDKLTSEGREAFRVQFGV